MDFGFALPPRGPMATPENIATFAQGERMGFGILAVTDHIIFPKTIRSAYPGGVGGQYYATEESQGEYLEALALLSFLAGITSPWLSRAKLTGNDWFGSLSHELRPRPTMSTASTRRPQPASLLANVSKSRAFRVRPWTHNPT